MHKGNYGPYQEEVAAIGKCVTEFSTLVQMRVTASRGTPALMQEIAEKAGQLGERVRLLLLAAVSEMDVEIQKKIGIYALDWLHASDRALAKLEDAEGLCCGPTGRFVPGKRDEVIEDSNVFAALDQLRVLILEFMEFVDPTPPAEIEHMEM